mmetsp:Transcript_84493/g.196449  ORF Transcript_84493/g.196449 Transcript_84493/m.196449 type:complete len:336 (-) Transcript_84493:1527-2534(-)
MSALQKEPSPTQPEPAALAGKPAELGSCNASPAGRGSSHLAHLLFYHEWLPAAACPVPSRPGLIWPEGQGPCPSPSPTGRHQGRGDSSSKAPSNCQPEHSNAGGRAYCASVSILPHQHLNGGFAPRRSSTLPSTSRWHALAVARAFLDASAAVLTARSALLVGLGASTCSCGHLRRFARPHRHCGWRPCGRQLLPRCRGGDSEIDGMFRVGLKEVAAVGLVAEEAPIPPDHHCAAVRVAVQACSEAGAVPRPHHVRPRVLSWEAVHAGHTSEGGYHCGNRRCLSLYKGRSCSAAGSSRRAGSLRAGVGHAGRTGGAETGGLRLCGEGGARSGCAG